MKNLNKRGADKIISVYWFGILVLVAGGIFLMVYTFYNHPYDVRGLEAKIMANKVADCLSKQGMLESDVFSNGNFNEDFKNNFLDKCNIIIDANDPQYYVKVGFFSVEDLSKSVFEIDAGNKNWVVDCDVQEDEEHEKLPECLEKRLYALGDSGEQHLIKILSIVGKVEENVK